MQDEIDNNYGLSTMKRNQMKREMNQKISQRNKLMHGG